MSGPSGLTTEQFVERVAGRLARYLAENGVEEGVAAPVQPPRSFRRNHDSDRDTIAAMFAKYDSDGDGTINMQEFETMVNDLGIAPTVHLPQKEKPDEVDVATP